MNQPFGGRSLWRRCTQEFYHTLGMCFCGPTLNRNSWHHDSRCMFVWKYGTQKSSKIRWFISMFQHFFPIKHEDLPRIFCFGDHGDTFSAEVAEVVIHLGHHAALREWAVAIWLWPTLGFYLDKHRLHPMQHPYGCSSGFDGRKWVATLPCLAVLWSLEKDHCNLLARWPPVMFVDVCWFIHW